MKKVFILFIFATNWVYSLVYYPGDLLNSVKRTQVITDLFSQKFNNMYSSFYPSNDIERDYILSRGYSSNTVDISLNGENIYKFPVNTPYGLQELTLFRVFGSTILKFDEITDFGLFKWGIGVGLAGFRYGMYKSINLNSSSVDDGGVDNNNFSVKDYLFSQVFDDLIVITNIFKPFGYIHFGLVMNKEVEPGLDGMLNTDDDVLISSKSRLYLDSNILGFIFASIGYNADRDRPETINTKIEVMSLISMFSDVYRYKMPDIFIGYSYINPTTKDIKLNDVSTGFIEFYYNFGYKLYIKSMLEVFLKGSTASSFIRQSFVESRFFLTEFVSNESINDFSGLFFIIGLSSFSSDKLKYFGSDSSSVTGYMVGLSCSFLFSGLFGYLEINVSRDYSQKLSSLVDSYGHTYFEAKLQIGL